MKKVLLLIAISVVGTTQLYGKFNKRDMHDKVSTLLANKQVNEAIQYLQQLINGGHTDALLKLANIYEYNLKDREGAKKILHKAAAAQNADAILQLATLYEQEGDIKSAIKHYQAYEDTQDEAPTIRAKIIELFEKTGPRGVLFSGRNRNK